MATIKRQFEGWETKAEIIACLDANGLSVNQMLRFRRKGLLPRVEQDPHGYHGSTTHFPPGTCAQIAALARHRRVKADLNYVGHQMWLESRPVHDRYWRPQLIKTAQRFDRAMRLIRRFLAQDEGSSGPTLQERVAASTYSNIIMSRIRRRLSETELAAHLGVLLSVGTGGFLQNSLSEMDDQTKTDRNTTIKAFDIGSCETDAVLGHKLRLTTTLPSMLQDISKAFESDKLSNIAEGRAQFIFEARDDVQNALRIGLALHDALSWSYGPKALGLGLISWIARKKTDWVMDLLILGFALLRQHSKQLLSSAETKALADNAEKVRRDSLQVRELAETDARFGKVYSPKRVRQGMQDRPSFNNLVKDVEIARGG